jgi:hypothetical protein
MTNTMVKSIEDHKESKERLGREMVGILERVKINEIVK